LVNPILSNNMISYNSQGSKGRGMT